MRRGTRWVRSARGRARWLTAGAIAAAACVGGVGTGEAVAARPHVAAVSSRPIAPAGARSVGAVANSTTLSGDVALKPRDPAGLAAYATAVSTPGSPDYHQYLTLAQFNAQYGPSQSTISAVTHALSAAGLTVGSVSGDGLLVGYSGTESQAASAFHTGFERYRLRGGRTAYANTAAAQLPTSITGQVQNVTGLNTFIVPQAIPPQQSTGQGAGATSTSVTAPKGAASPCAAAKKTASSEGGLTADQVAHAYGLDPLYSSGDFGNGQKIDILDLFGYNQSDITAFDDCYYGASEGAQVASRLTATDVDGGSQIDNGLQGGTDETELDAETVAAYAPQAQADVFEAPDTNDGFLDDVAAMTDDTASRIETISYGTCEENLQQYLPGYVQEENTLFEQAAAEGKTVFASTGDSGSDTCANKGVSPAAPYLSASDPASQPYVTAVGGTGITAATDPPAEEVWNDGADGGAAGGGISDIWSEAAWQSDSQVPGINNASVIASAEKVDGNDFCQTGGDAARTPCREVPDVSAQASPNIGGFPTYVDGAFYDFGGTSLSSPTWAAILADINSTPACVSAGGSGFISPELYAIASVPAEYAASFNDITTGDNDQYGVGGGDYPSTTGYDMASGLGSPRVTSASGGDGLAYYLCAAAAAATPTVSSVSPRALSSTQVSGGTSLTVYGSEFESGSTPDVAGVTIGTVQVPSSDISVESPGQIVISPVPADVTQTGTGGTGGGEGTYDVTVTLTGGATSAPTPASTLVLYGGTSSGSTPTLAGTSPSAGVESGGSTVTIYGSGFSESPIKSVTFGGVPAQSYSVVNDNEISAVTPKYTSATSCASSDDPSTGTCQTQVAVTNATATTTEPALPPEYSGPLNGTQQTLGEYDYPAANEFDYEPAPHITSITPTTGASEAGGTELTINGTGFGALGLEWVNVGPYGNDASEVIPDSVSSTQLTVTLPQQTATTTPLSLPVTVQTYGSPNQAPGATLTGTPPSNAVNVTYDPTPTVTGVSTPNKYDAGPTSGGTPITVTGSGFTDADEVILVDAKYGFQSTQFNLTSVSNTQVTFNAPSTLPGAYGIEVCNGSGCSKPSAQLFTTYVPGNPSVTSIKPTTGSAGTRVVITGNNLGWVKGVTFGSKPATSFHNAPAGFEDGSTTKVIAIAPAGTSGRTVNVRVTTLESEATGSGPSPVTSGDRFTYTG